MRSDLVEQNLQRNRETAGSGDAYSPHRDMVMKLISATVADLTGKADGKCSSVVLLGAGNCLDVDLAALAKLFGKIHLVDLDQAALADAIGNGELPADHVHVHAPIDIAEPLLSLTSRDFKVADENRDQVIDLLQRLSSENGVAEVPESDIVVSLCVFSQIIDALQFIVPPQHPTFGHAIKSLRLGHLRRMLSMLRPGGVAIFVTDVVSSEAAPQLKETTVDDLPDLVKELVSEKNFFSGTNPATVLTDLNMLSRLPSGPDTVHTIDPWLWEVGEKTFAVYAFRIQKKPPVEEAPEGDDGQPEE